MTADRHDPFGEDDDFTAGLTSFTPEKQAAAPDQAQVAQIEKLAAAKGYAQRTIANDPDEKNKQIEEEPKRSLTFQLPVSICEEFGYLAAKEFGHVKGAKTKFFLKLFEGYVNKNHQAGIV